MQVKHEKIVLFFRTGIIWCFLTIFAFLMTAVYQFINPTDKFFEIPLKHQVISILGITSCVTLFIFLDLRKEPQIVEYNRSDIEFYLVYLDYYTLLIPIFFIFLLFIINLLSLIYYPNKMLINFCLTLYSIALVSLILSLFLKIIFDSKANITLKMANNIFSKYLYGNEDCREQMFYRQKFSSYLNKSINNIDRGLAKNLKINNLEHKKEIPIKQLIKKYIGNYIAYGTQAELIDLKDNLNHISTSINRDDYVISLENTEYIFKIYVNIKDFLAKRNYIAHISKTSRYFNFNLSFHWLIIIFLLIISGVSANHSILVGNNNLSDASKEVIKTLLDNNLLLFILTFLQIIALILQALFNLLEY